jgi:hypothetical protein
MKQAMAIFEQPKDASKTFIQHLSYLVEVNAAAGGMYQTLVLDSVVKYSCPELRDVLLARFNPYRADHLRQAEELTHFAQAVWCERKPVKTLGREVKEANAVTSSPKRPECSYCHKRGHEADACWKKNKSNASRTSRTPKEYAMNADEDSNGAQDCTESMSWILDSGCSRNLVGRLDILTNVQESSLDLNLPNGSKIKATKRGEVKMKTYVNDEAIILTIKDVEYVPGLTKNLLSYGVLEKKGIRLHYEGARRYLIKDRNKIAEVHLKGELLTINGKCLNKPSTSDLICNIVANQEPTTNDVHEDTLYNFHLRLGHLHYDAIKRLADQDGSNIKLSDEVRRNCLICAEGKQTKNAQSKKDSGTNAPIDRIGGVICSDLKGPITPVDRLKNRYVVNFIDYKTNYCRVFLAKTKDQAAKQFEAFLAFFERRYDCKIQVLRTDGGGEYANVDLFCQQTGVQRQTTEANSPASNGKAERMNRTVFNMARCMIFNSGLPMRFWGDAVKYAAYVLNRSPSRSNPRHQSPIQMLEGHAPNLTDIVIFGSPCMVYRDQPRTFKPRAVRGLILGRSEETKGYVVYLTADQKVTTTQHVKDIETLSPEQNATILANSGVDTSTAGSGEATQKEGAQVVQTMVQEEPEAPSKVKTRGKDKRKPSQRAKDAQESLSANNVAEEDPTTYSAAMKTDKAKEWQVAVDDELNSLRQSGTWIAVPKPPHTKILHSKWVFKTKRDASGGVERYKARLVACGNEQVHGESYNETFAPVMDMTTARFIMAMGLIWNVPPRHGDVPNAYVRAQGEEGVDIYMYAPKGMKLSAEELRNGGDEAVLKILMSLYGLKQAGRLWNALLHSKMIELKFTQCKTDLCLYFKKNDKDIILVGVYVDDLLVTATKTPMVAKFFEDMQILDVKDLGIVTKFLGIRVIYEEGSFTLDHEAMIKELINAHGMGNASSTLTPIADIEGEERDDEVALDFDQAKKFRSLAGALLWITRCTRPDIGFAVHRLTRKTHAPRVQDWKLAKRVLRYLNGTSDLKLYNRQRGQDKDSSFEVFSDADYAADREDRKSVSGSMVYLNGLLITWSCMKQDNVTLSTMESEFVAAGCAVQSLLGCTELSSELGQPIKLPSILLMDNQAAISQIKAEASSNKSKHVDIKHKFIKDYYQKGLISPTYVSTMNMKADILTKAMPAPTFRRLRDLIGLAPVAGIHQSGGVLEV